MNIESYTIIFLKKQKYLNLPGIGNFRLVKNGSTEEVEFSPVSIIDDHFASFIGVNENVSSNNAANAISKYSKEIKNSLKDGKAVNIPGLGTLKQTDGRISFQQEDDDTFLKPIDNKHFRDLTFGSGSMSTMSPEITVQHGTTDDHTTDDDKLPSGTKFQTETYNPAYDDDILAQQTEKRERQKRMTKSLLSVVLILSILGILIWAFYNFLNSSNEAPAAGTPSSTEEVNNQVAAGDSTATAAAPTSNSNEWNFVVKSYDSEISADKRAKQLTDYGWNASKEKSSEGGDYNIVITMPNDGRDVESVTDSLRKVLNPGGKVYLKK